MLQDCCFPRLVALGAHEVIQTVSAAPNAFGYVWVL